MLVEHGRESEEGNVIIQTYNPENYSITYAQKQNYDLFYNLEIQIRKQLKYPPFCDILMIVITSENEQDVVNIANKIHCELKQKIVKDKLPIMLYSPLPAPVDKIKNKFRWRIIVKCIADDNIVSNVQEIMKKVYLENNSSLRINVDINPTNMI